MTTQLSQYRAKTDAELLYIAKDAHAAAVAMQPINPQAEAKYLDQVNDACSVLFERRRAERRAAKQEA